MVHARATSTGELRRCHLQALWSCLFENRYRKSPELKLAWQAVSCRYGEAQIILRKLS